MRFMDARTTAPSTAPLDGDQHEGECVNARPDLIFPLEMKKRRFSYLVALCSALLIPCHAENLVTKVDQIDGIKMDFIPDTDGRYLYFSRYDNTGNAKEFIKYDPLAKSVIATVGSLGTMTVRYLWSDDINIVIHDMQKRQVIVHDLTKHNQRLRLSVEGGVAGGWVEKRKLYVVSKDFSGGRGEQSRGSVFDIDSGKELSQRVIAGSVLALPWRDQIIAVDVRSIHLYDKEFNQLGTVDVPYKPRFNSSCDRGPAVINGDRLFLVANCGEIYVIDLLNRKVDHTFGYFSECMFPSISIEDGVMAVGSRSGDNTTCEVKLVNVADKSLLSTLSLRPGAVLLRDKKLILSYFDTWSKPTRIEIYQLASNVLDKDQYYGRDIHAAHQRALESYRRDGDVYQVLVLLERANPARLLSEKAAVEKDVRIAVLNDYGFFLSLTLDRYQEAVPILEQVVDEFPERAVAYLNLSDVYWKKFLFHKNDSWLKKANVAYERYKSLMQQIPNNRIVSRKYSVYRPIFDLSKQLRPNNLQYNDELYAAVFVGNDVYVPSYTPGAGGPRVSVLNRDTFEHKASLSFLHDDQFQDNISSIVVCKGKIFVAMNFRYEDSSRPSLYVFNSRSYKEIGRFVFPGTGLGEVFCFSDFLYAGSTTNHGRSEYREIDPNMVTETGKTFNSSSLGSGYVRIGNSELLKQYLLGRKQLVVKGSYSGRDGTFIETLNAPTYPVGFFNLYDLATGTRVEDIPVVEGATHLSTFVTLLSENRVINLEFARVRNRLVAYDLSTRKGKILFQDRYIGPVIAYKRYLIFGLSRSLIFYDLQTEEVVDVLTGVTGPESEKRTDNLDAQKISSLVIDRDRLLIGAHGAPYSKILDLTSLK